MGDILIVSADYIVGNQTIDVVDYVTTQQSSQYGAIDFPVQKLDDDLRKDNRITLAKDSDPLKLTPPKLTIQYTNESGAYHSVTYAITEKVALGERSAFGKFVQKPGDVLSSFGTSAGMILFGFSFVLIWALGVAWAYKQWEYLQSAYISGALTSVPSDDLGILGKWVGVFVFFLFKYGETLGKFGGSGAQPGWIVKFIFSFLAAITPVSSLIFQFLIWFTVVQSLLTRK
jgi:hypothetical protein